MATARAKAIKNWESIGKKNSNCIITSYLDKAKRHHHVVLCVYMCVSE